MLCRRRRHLIGPDLSTLRVHLRATKHYSATRSEPLEEFRRQPALGRCAVSPLEWGGRYGDPNAAKDRKIFPDRGMLGVDEHFINRLLKNA
jgi:hypothetical protein